MPLQHIHALSLNTIFSFDPDTDVLGSGTVGQVFRVKILKSPINVNLPHDLHRHSHFALKRFIQRSDRDDFDNERSISEALATAFHPHIITSLATWTDPTASYMLLPLADGDLYHLLRQEKPPKVTQDCIIWLLEQARGLCNALECLHNYNTLDKDDQESGEQRIGFHHDLKPANILLFGTDFKKTTWKLCDFGSGTIKRVASSNDSIYNRKASTGDPIYSAPEYVVDGKVSRPKDIWSLGCIFVEVLVWILDDSEDVIKRFEEARKESNIKGSQDPDATYWSYKQGGTNNLPVLNAAVVQELNAVKDRCRKLDSLLEAFFKIVEKMLTLNPRSRPRAVQLRQLIDVMLSKPHLSENVLQ